MLASLQLVSVTSSLNLDPTLLPHKLRLIPNNPILTESSNGCPPGTFACHDDKSRCIPQSWICDGFDDGCADLSNILASQCNNCTADHLFKCQLYGGSFCVNEQHKCDGILDCLDFADELQSVCDNCTADHLFKCENSGKTICLNENQKCNGIPHCDDLADELASQCDNCTADHLFKCENSGKTICLNKNQKCNGIPQCDDLADELASECENCEANNLLNCQIGDKSICVNETDWFACKDGSTCVHKSLVNCEGLDFKEQCADKSDIFASQCNNCSAEHLFKCQFGGHSLCWNRKYECDGLPHCDDAVDELLSVCGNCSDDAMFVCRINGHNTCLTKAREQCDGFVRCDDAADELMSLCGNCTATQFVCRQKGQDVCTDKQFQCDGLPHCENGGDELLSVCGNCLDDAQFVCRIKGKDVCLDKQLQCDGLPHCENGEDELLSVCGDCSDDAKFVCRETGKDVCLDKQFQCDGILRCDNGEDELLSVCGNCSDDAFFVCRINGQDTCLMKTPYQCDGHIHCEDAADELLSLCGTCSNTTFYCNYRGVEICYSKADYECDGIWTCTDALNEENPSVCANCTQPGLAMCKDMSVCIKAKWLCDGITLCNDGSDESDTWSNCTFCSQNNSVPCPGFPGNCAQICDGNPTCPDKWDELLSTCDAFNVPCNENTGLFRCNDGSRCLGKDEICNQVKDCDSGEDESSDNCDDCQSLRFPGRLVHFCDNSCIRQNQVCSARNQTLCKDGSDMSASICTSKEERTCYIDFPHEIDPYRWPCNDGTRCILKTSRCDSTPDCPDHSDENGCPWYIRLELVSILLICLAAVVQIFLFNLLLGAWSHSLSLSSPSRNQAGQSAESPVTPSSSIMEVLGGSNTPSLSGTERIAPLNPAPHSPSSTLLSLLHPALNDLEGQHWNWQNVGKELRIEHIFFNRDSQFLVSFLSNIEIQDAHPDTVHKVFQAFFCHLESEGLNENAVAFSIKQAIGHHRLAHLTLKGPPNLLDRKVYELRKFIEKVQKKNKFCFAFIYIFQILASCVSPFILFLDYVKDPLLLLILRSTVQRLEEGCDSLFFARSCLAASQAEKNLLDALLVTLSVSILTTSIHAFHQRNHFFKRNYFFDFVLFISSPLLPAIYHWQIVSISKTLESEKKSMTIAEYEKRKHHLAKLTDIIQQSKAIEIGIEAITQILILCGLATFYPFVFKAPSGQSYSYFFGVALLVLKGNAPLFCASIVRSVLGPCFFYVNYENNKKKESLNSGRKVVLFLRNFTFLLARLATFVSALFSPVISQWNIFVANEGVDASDRLDHGWIKSEFDLHFSVGLQALSDKIGKNAKLFLFFFCFHLLIVATHAVLRSPKFVTSTMKERWLHLVSSFWLPLPFLTIRGVDRGEEKPELWFLITLHTCENVALLLTKRWSQVPAHPHGLLVADISIVTLNALAVALSLLYTKKMELYANLPDSVPNLPSFGQEVNMIEKMP